MGQQKRLKPSFRDHPKLCFGPDQQVAAGFLAIYGMKVVSRKLAMQPVGGHAIHERWGWKYIYKTSGKFERDVGRIALVCWLYSDAILIAICPVAIISYIHKYTCPFLFITSPCLLLSALMQ